MSEILLSLNNSVLKLSTLHKGIFKNISTTLPTDISSGSRIIDQEAFGKILNDHINELVGTRSGHTLDYIVEPQDLMLGFIVVSKSAGDPDSQVISQIRERVGANVDETYIVYQKIAPFIYQYIGIDKAFIHQVLDVANYSQLSLRSLIPWVLLLPKISRTVDPVVFLAKSNTTYTVSLSELSGIFFTAVYTKEKTIDEIQHIIKDLAFYKRANKPIEKIYTFNYPDFGSGENITPLDIPHLQDTEVVGFEQHVLTKYILDSDPELTTSYINLLNIVPMPAVSKPRPLVYVGASLAAVVLLLGGIYFVNRNKLPTNASPEVLSESVSETTIPVPDQPVEPKPELKKSDLKIRVENGAGISGVAGKLETILKEKGYTVVSIGNASTSGNKKTIINLTTEKAAYKDLLINDVSALFDFEIKEPTEPSTEYDVLIVVGTEINF